MKNKRFYLVMIALIIVIVLVSCSNKEDSLNSAIYPNSPIKEGIQPYDLSDNEKYLLRSFGMEGNSHIRFLGGKGTVKFPTYSTTNYYLYNGKVEMFL